MVPLLFCAVLLCLRGDGDAPAADLADMRWDALAVKVRAGETLVGIEAAVLHTDHGVQHVYVPRARAADFEQARRDLGLRKAKHAPFIDRLQLKAFEAVGAVRIVQPRVAGGGYEEVHQHTRGKTEVAFDERGMQLIASGLHLDGTLGVSLTDAGRSRFHAAAVRRCGGRHGELQSAAATQCLHAMREAFGGWMGLPVFTSAAPAAASPAMASPVSPLTSPDARDRPRDEITPEEAARAYASWDVGEQSRFREIVRRGRSRDTTIVTATDFGKN